MALLWRKFRELARPGHKVMKNSSLGKLLVIRSNSDGKSTNIKDLLEEARGTDTFKSPPEFISDLEDLKKNKEEYKKWKQDQAKHSFRPKVNPTSTTIFLFPGQGSQYVGMGSSLLHYPNVSTMFKLASNILGYDLLDVCLNGPEQKLNRTIYSQPAILVTSLAAIEKLKVEYPSAIENCVTAAGFSVGEFSALVFADALSFEDAVYVVKKRAEAMQKASELYPSSMATVFLTPGHKLKLGMDIARRYCSEKLEIENPVCRIANYMYTEVKVIAGNTEAIEFLETNKSDFGIRRIKRLPVSGAFHTELMKSAETSVQAALKAIKFNKPIVPVHSNVTSHMYGREDDIPKLLVKQLTAPVKWEQIMHVLYSRKQGKEFPMTYELGPGKSLGMLLKMTNRKAYDSYKSVSA